MDDGEALSTSKVKTVIKKMTKGQKATVPEVHKNEKLVRKTRSICPTCYRILPAVVVERDDKIWIRKECPEHGEVEALYWGDADMYHKAMGYQVPERELTGINVTEMDAPCPLNCGYCPQHKNQTALANITVTNRCELSCWYCFFFAKKLGYVFEPSIQEIREMVRSLRKQGPFTPNAVQITGGEPLVREDLPEIVEAIREEEITHIQLNTNGVKFTNLLLNEGMGTAVSYARRLKEAGVNTLYLSFDGVTPQSNPKNHYEIPYDFNIFRLSGLHSVVLVPTISKTGNSQEVGDIIEFACQNGDIVQGVDFQPISFVGSTPPEKRKEDRITIPGVIINIEEQTNGEIPREAWFPITWPHEFSEFIENLTGEPTVKFSNHPACGMATYIFPETTQKDGIRREVENYIPITDFIDVEGLREYLAKKTKELKRGHNKWIVASKLLGHLMSRFVDPAKEPTDVNSRFLLAKILWRRSYEALGDFQRSAMFLGMMHFQDPYNYDIERVERCCISYLSPNGRVLPFCAYNVLPDLYRDKIIKEYGVPIEEWEKEHPRTTGKAIKYQREVAPLKSTELYQRTYKNFL